MILRGVAQTGASDCAAIFELAQTAREVVERDHKQLSATTDDRKTDSRNSESVLPDSLRQDLILLQQREAELARCDSANILTGDSMSSAEDCAGEQLLNFQANHVGEMEQEIAIFHLPASDAFFFVAGMTIDADGAPNAYHPDNTGLDDLSNAGAPGNWVALAKDGDGEPFVQGLSDPFPGYYISETALADRSRALNDPLRYVDASKIPYIVLPGHLARLMGARPGDFAVVLNQRNARISYAIFGDVGPPDRIGEGSIALAENLEIRSDARNGGVRRGIVYLVFPGSGNRNPRSIEEIDTEGEILLQGWGGPGRLAICASQQPIRLPEEIHTSN